jgi:hypothetical protein
MKTPVLWGLLLAVAAGAAQADNAALQRCRIVAEAAARLACYDAIALPGVGSRAGWGAPVPGAAPAAAAAVAPGVSASSPASSFGLPASQADAEADQLQSRIVGLVETFPRGAQYRLENGQVWQITETTMGFYQLNNPKVTISRGLLGNFYLQIEGVAATPKVRRLQ